MTDFLCPVKGCDAIYADWESLKKHLSDKHDQDIALEQYNEWREEAGVNRTTEQKQEQNRDRTGPRKALAGRDVPVSDTSDTSLSCPECGKTFDRGNLMSSFNSVKMHAIKAHGKRLYPSDFGLETEAEGPPTPSRKPVKEEEEEQGFFEPMKVEGEPLVRMPDVYQSLWKHARQFGLSKKGADTFTAAMRTRDPDDLDEMENVLRDMKADTHTIKLLIDNWARQRGTFRGGFYGRGYGSYGSQGYDYRYGRRERDLQPEPKDETDVLIDKEYRRATKLRVIKALKGEEDSEVKMLRDELLNLRDELRRSRDSRVEELEKKLQQEREQRHLNELKALETRMNLRIEAIEKEKGTLVERQGVKAMERVGDVGERLVHLGEKMVVSTAYKHGILEPVPSPPRERHGPGGVEALLPAEFIERQAKGEAEA